MGFFEFCARNLKNAREILKEKNKDTTSGYHYSLKSLKRAKNDVCKKHKRKAYKTRVKYNPEKDTEWR